jgi:hypothetical protein
VISKWESEEERLLKFMKIPAKKKLEWLYQMHQFINKFYSKRKKKFFQKLRGIR